MIEFIFAPFNYSFITHALMIAIIVCVPCAILSVYLILKGWALMGDAISHAVLPGIVVAWMTGIPLALGAFFAGMLCAITTGYLTINSRIKQDTVLGIVFSGMFAVGVVMFVALKPEVHLDHILFGDMLGISVADIIQSAVITVLVLTVMLVKWRDLLLFCFDIQQARICGLRTGWLHYSMLSLVSITIVSSLKSVGMILSVSLLIAPGAIALLLTQRFHIALFLSVAVSIIACFAGIMISFYLDSAPAATIVVFFFLVFVGVFTIKIVQHKINSVKTAQA